MSLLKKVSTCAARGERVRARLTPRVGPQIHAEADYDANEKVGYNEFCAATRERDT